MTYIVRQKRPARKAKTGLSGLFDLFAPVTAAITGNTTSACPPSETYNKMKAQIADLQANWNPTGVYTWNNVADMVATVSQLSAQASSLAVAFFGGASSSSAKARVRAAADAYNQVAKQAGEYTVTWQTAKQNGVPISAPGFKQWVIDDLTAAMNLLRTVEVEVCNTPWFITAAVALSSFFIQVAQVAKQIGGIALKVGENALKAVERTGNLLAFLIQYGPYIAIGGGALYLYAKRKRS